MEAVLNRGLIVLFVLALPLALATSTALSSTTPVEDFRTGTYANPNKHFGAHAPAFTQREAVKLHPSYRAALKKPGRPHFHVGRDILHHGRARDGKIIWRDVIEQTQRYWIGLHPNSSAAIDSYYRQTSDSWGTVLRTWKRNKLPSDDVRFYTCIPEYEGGYGNPYVWFGGSTGWVIDSKTGRGIFEGSDRVVNHFQTRPYHASIAVPRVEGRDDRVTYETFVILTWPRHAATIAPRVGRHAYATVGNCS